jgi:eukaryotic-like serine/threonine-protein kinase
MSDEVYPGMILGERYRLEKPIGTGGMSSVWSGRDLELDREVAIKLVADTLAQNAAFMGRFHREARMAASFSHPNVVRIYDFDGSGDPPFLVMERIHGGTLAEHDAPDPRRLAEQLLAALDQIHRAGVVHRDVKPANVLLDPNGNAILTDFGIAHSEEATRYTEPGALIGTPGYIAPELQRGGDATPRSDLFALGVLLQEVIQPLPPELATLTTALTKPEASERPESAAAAHWLLEKGALPPPSAEPTVPVPTAITATGYGARWRPGRRLIAGGLAALLLLAAGGAALALSGGGEPGAETQATAETTSTQSTTSTGSTTSTQPTTSTQSTTSATTPSVTVAPECAQLEAEKRLIEAEKQAAELDLQADPAAKDAAVREFEAQILLLNERIAACQETP